MSHTADVAQDHETRAVEEKKLGKRVAHVTPGEGARSLWVMGEVLTYKIPSHQTGGAYALFETVTQPGAGPPPHVHHREDESFWVLEGEYEFLVEGRAIRAGAGSLIYVPKGNLHAHRNVGEGAGRMLATQTPGGLYERFFEEVGKPVDGGGAASPNPEDRPEAEDLVAIAARYGIEIPLPASDPAAKYAPMDGSTPAGNGDKVVSVASQTTAIRYYEMSDAPGIALLFYETVRSVNRTDYSGEQVEAWAPDVPDPEELHDRLAGQLTLVAEEGGEVVGFAALEGGGHLDMLFVRRDAVGRGVGRKLYEATEREARGQGLARIFTEASITARPFFERQGFRTLREQTVSRQGVNLTNFVMEKVLPG